MERSDMLTSLHERKLTELGAFKSRVIKLSVWQQDAEVNLTGSFLKSCVFVYVLCTCISFDSLALFMNFDVDALSRCYEVMFLLIYLYWALSIAFYLYLYSKQDLKRGDQLLITATSVSTGFVYIGYPLFMRILLSRIFGRVIATNYGITSTNVNSADYFMTFIVFVSGALFVGIFLFLMRNRIPAEKVLASCVDSHREASIYAINMILIVLDTLAYRLKVQSSIKITIQLIQLLLIVGNLVTLKRKRLFWNETFNEFYAGGLSVGYVIQIIYALIVWKTLPTAIFSLLLFFATLAARTASNLIRRRAVLPVFSTKLDSISQREAIMALENAWVSTRDMPTLENPLRETFLRFVGKISKLSSSHGAPQIQEYLKDPYESVLKYLEGLPNLDSDHYMLETLLIFQLTNILPSLVKFNLYLRKYEKTCERTLSGMLNYYRIADLFELKIKLLYRGRITQDDASRLSVRAVYHDLNTLQSSSDEENFLDLCMVVRRKHEYKLFCDCVNNVLSLQSQQFTLLESASKKLFSKMFQNNKMIKLATNKADKCASRFTSDLDRPEPTYPLMGVIYYHRVVRHQVKKANDLFLIYKAKRTRLINASVAEGITPENMLKNGAIFECSLQRGSVGNIVDFSPDVEETLGKLPNDIKLEGVNINIIFPKLLQAPHTVYMEKMESFPQLNLQRLFFIIGFDGNLREVKFLVKFVPKIQQTVTAIVYARPVQMEGKMMLILSQSHQIIAAQEKFWNVVNACQIKSKLKNMEKLSLKICKAIEIFKAFEQFGGKSIDHRETKLRIVRRELLKVYDALTYCNNIQGIEVPIDQSSPYYTGLYNLSIVVNIHFLRFKHILLTKLYMKFELITDKSTQSMLRISSPQGGTITPDHVIQESKLEEEVDLEDGGQSASYKPGNGPASPVMEQHDRVQHRSRTSAGVDKNSTNRNFLFYVRDCIDVLLKYGIFEDYLPGRAAQVSSKCELADKSLLKLAKLLGEYEVEQHHQAPVVKTGEKQHVNLRVHNFESKKSDPDSGLYHYSKTETASQKETTDNPKPLLFNVFGLHAHKDPKLEPETMPEHKQAQQTGEKKGRHKCKEPSILHNLQILSLLGFHNGQNDQEDSRGALNGLVREESMQKHVEEPKPEQEQEALDKHLPVIPRLGLFSQQVSGKNLPEPSSKALMKTMSRKGSPKQAKVYVQAGAENKKAKIMGLTEKVPSALGDVASPKKKSPGMFCRP